MKDFSKYANTHRAIALIDLASIRHNGALARKIFNGQKILSVLKADAYGHGIANVLPAYETFTDAYAVATVEEGLRVRSGSKKPILVFGAIPEKKMTIAARAGLTLTVGSLPYAERLSRTLSAAGLMVTCHLKIDTGLNRSGICYREEGSAIEEIRCIHALPSLSFTGTYTHFACGEGSLAWEQAFTRRQFERFMAACVEMQREGLTVGVRHAAATGAALVYPEYRLDMVRLGMLPLGMSYSDESVADLGLRSVLTLVSFISEIHTLEAGEAVSYGCTYRAKTPRRIAVVTCGYADGYRRNYSNRTRVIVNGYYAPILGRIAMDYCMIDVTDAPGTKVGDTVILLGTDGTCIVSPQEISECCDSVSGEVTCAISARVPRVVCD